ncbi:hypothetical protein Pelo_10075 [Pelomyxa schiedti]|nr:hypothetical protein Pelo_10075 [Pelomyxa schiedti]
MGQAQRWANLVARYSPLENPCEVRKKKMQRVEWVVDPRVTFRDQIVALMMSSHPRCGRNSPASALTSHNVPLFIELAERWSRGAAVIYSSGFGTSVLVGLSLHTLGATPWLMEWPIETDYRPSVTWMDTSHCLELPSNSADNIAGTSTVANVETGEKCVLLGTTKNLGWCLVAQGKWVLDPINWIAWKAEHVVTCDCGDGEFEVLKPLAEGRGLRPVGWGKWGEGVVPAPERFGFARWVGDGLFNISWYGTGWCAFHLVDIERAFETGEMVPVDTVVRRLPKQFLDNGLDSWYCFWASKRVVVIKDYIAYELMENGEARLLCKYPTNWLGMENFFITQRKELIGKCESWDFTTITSGSEPTVITLPPSTWSEEVKLKECGDFIVVEEDLKIHLVDPASGVYILTLGTNSSTSLNCVKAHTLLQ